MLVLAFQSGNDSLASMWLKSTRVKNIKGFIDSGTIEFSRGINVLVGANNSGKSTILRSIQLLQPIDSASILQRYFEQNVRRASSSAEVLLELSDPNHKQLQISANYDLRNWLPMLQFTKTNEAPQSLLRDPTGNFKVCTFPICQQREPNNFIYPYFSRRKPTEFTGQSNEINAQTVEEITRHLVSKVDRLSDPEHPSHTAFRDACNKTLGFNISCIQSGDGKQVGLRLADGTLLAVNSMGEGTLNILVMLVHLSYASGKLFLIEEIENDLHPRALKALMEYLIERSEFNQFIVSTHSNIVTKCLSSAPNANLISIRVGLDAETKIPTSSCEMIGDDPKRRIELLEDLGYEPSDFYLWKAYLLLEESTAERLIKDFIIPHMVPALDGNLKTVAASGIADVEARFVDFHRLFTFIHTCPQYAQRAWVAVDGGQKGKEVISKLQVKYKSWPAEHFRSFGKNDFEYYYPPRFHTEVTNALGLPNGLERQRAKNELVQQILRWTRSDPETAKKEFKSSAAEILEFLQEIAAKLN